jgi:uncharacterized protein (DUF2267 family)
MTQNALNGRKIDPFKAFARHGSSASRLHALFKNLKERRGCAMNETQLPVLDHTVQLTNIWLKKLGEEHHLGDRQHSYSALRAVLHALRDRLTPQQAVHFGAQLPILVRGVYYEGWHFSDKPSNERQVEDFVAHVATELPPKFPRDAHGVTKAVFDLLWKELDPGETAKIIDALPVPLHSLWPEHAQR